MEKLLDDVKKFNDIYKEKMLAANDKDYLGCWADNEIIKITVAIMGRLHKLEERISKLEDS